MSPTRLTHHLRRVRRAVVADERAPRSAGQWRGLFTSWLAVGALLLAQSFGPEWLRVTASAIWGLMLAVAFGWAVWVLTLGALSRLHRWRHRNDPRPALSRLVIHNARVMPLAADGTPLAGGLSREAASELVTGYLFTAMPGCMPGHAEGPISTRQLATARIEFEWQGTVAPDLHALLTGAPTTDHPEEPTR